MYKIITTNNLKIRTFKNKRLLLVERWPSHNNSTKIGTKNCIKSNEETELNGILIKIIVFASLV
jgi:hypothetical protein